jgi:ABC-type uncharacterized transport system substrate-binding protein
LRRRVPVFGFSPAFVRAGALIGVGIDPHAQGRQAGELVRLSLARSPTADSIPNAVRLAPTYQLAVNLTVARKLGVTLPAEFIAHADQVFGGDER